MELELESVNFRPGDVIKGKATLKLKKPKEAMAVRAFLKAYKKQRTYSGNRGNSTKTIEIYKFEKLLDGEKEYPKGDHEYPFEIEVPNPLPIKEMGGKLGTVIDTLNSLSGSGVRWYVEVVLDISGALDISKKQQVNIGE